MERLVLYCSLELIISSGCAPGVTQRARGSAQAVTRGSAQAVTRGSAQAVTMDDRLGLGSRQNLMTTGFRWMMID